MSSVNQFEQINSDKVRERVREDGKQAVKQAVEKVVGDLSSRGFDPAQVRPLVKEGAAEALK